MAKRTRTARTRGGWLQFFSFVAVMLLGLSLAISLVLTKIDSQTFGNLAGWLKNIAIAIALLIPVFYSYYEARRQGTVWFILWVIAVILIVVFYVWGVL